VRQRVREMLNLDSVNLSDPQYRAKRFDSVVVSRALLQNSATNLRSGLGVPQPDANTVSINDQGSGFINVAGRPRSKRHHGIADRASHYASRV
jgi:hypothetical protein